MKTIQDALTLQVVETQAKDVGRGIARIDPKDMAKLGLEVGDIVELEGKRKTVAKVMPAFPEDRGKKIVQIDGIVRENAKIGLGEKLSLKKASSKPAERIVLSPLTLVRTLRYDRDQKYIGTLLEGLPMIVGDRIRANLFGARSCDFEVLDTTPKGAVVIHPGTTIKMEAEEAAERKRGTKVSYEDIGGLGREIQRVREMIELPLKYPEIFERLGIEAPKGVFLHGPPGCGKTLIARAVANETDAYFLSISGPEIMGKFYGESEARLRSVFEDGQAHAPSIIFIDEIDAIAPKREEMGGEKQVERRVVAQLLSLMDGIESRGQVIVIGASVTGDTPVLVKDQGLVPIGSLVDRYYQDGEFGHPVPVQGMEVLGYEPGDYGHRRRAHRFLNAKFQAVSAVFRHRVKEICEIEITGGHKIRVTPGHSLFARGHGGIRPVKASDLRPGDRLVGLPYSSYMFRRFSRPAVFDSIIPETPASSPLDEETAYLFGLWLAEGYIRDKKTVDFCLSEKEELLIKRIKAWAKRLLRKPYNHPTRLGGAVNVGFTHAELARFITDNFGAGSKNKHLPFWSFVLPDNLFLSLLTGWADGDGWKGKDGRVEVTTTSLQLARDMLWACRFHNIWASMGEFQYKGFGRGTAYRLNFSMANSPWGKPEGSKKRWPKRLQPRVKSVRALPFDGYVYDLCGCVGEAFYGGQMPVLLHNTNIPNVIDPALRRPGRFDREISIPIPDRKARREILDIHTRGMPLAKQVDLDRLAEITHGFVGADLEALSREAAMICLGKILPNVDFELDEIPYETILKLEVTQEHFLEALRETEPSAIREVFAEVPNVHWSDVGGLESVKKELMEAVEWPLKHEALFKKANLTPPKGILLSGPPGTGKTLLAKALATESEVNFISVKGPELISKFLGESERGVREIFRKARQVAPTIIFFDEFDSLVPVRGKGGGDSQTTERVISQFLTELDGIESLKGVLVLAATNRLDMIDPAVLRPGRFDLKIEIPIPDEKARRAIFEVHTQGKPLGKDVDLSDLAHRTEDLVGSDIEAICREATLQAIRNVIDRSGAKGSPAEVRIAKKDFDFALKRFKKQIET